jgi:hypothetical protein
MANMAGREADFCRVQTGDRISRYVATENPQKAEAVLYAYGVLALRADYQGRIDNHFQHVCPCA